VKPRQNGIAGSRGSIKKLTIVFNVGHWTLMIPLDHHRTDLGYYR
jgi:hypothetical protein